MRNFSCDACGQTLYFESVRCVKCGQDLAYLPDEERVAAIDPKKYRLCANSVAYGVCNWAVPLADPNKLCRACRMNEVIPNLSQPGRQEGWHRLENAKRRLLYTLEALQLSLEGVSFSFMEDGPGPLSKVFTGHRDRRITINLAEADDPFREKLRQQLGEGYRTLLGHFRHEIGHYYWDRLIQGSTWYERFRALFGDEQAEYDAALQRHYAKGPPSDWPERFISAYATMHPWEDWAETWAHYLHMIDTLGTARAYGLALRPEPVGSLRSADPTGRTHATDVAGFDELAHSWVALTLALNSLNRSMGLIDPYPFVLGPAVLQKLAFVHEVVTHSAAR